MKKRYTYTDRDFDLPMNTCLKAYHINEQDLITTRPTLAELDTDTHTGSYKWLRYPIPDEQPETVEDMILSGVEEFPNDCLAGILLAILKNRVPKGILVNGMSIDMDGKFFRFCISGSTSLEDLQTLREQFELTHDFEIETKT